MVGLPVCCTMVSIVVLQGDGADTRMLLAQRRSQYMDGIWSYIAGHIESDETGWQAARRELDEETGLQPESLYATSFSEQFYDLAKDCIQIVPAFVALVPPTACVRLNDEHAAYAWLTIEEAMTRLPFGSQRDLLAHVRREFIERTPAKCLRVPFATEEN